MHLRYSGILNYSFIRHLLLSPLVKGDQHLVKLWARVECPDFFLLKILTYMLLAYGVCQGVLNS